MKLTNQEGLRASGWLGLLLIELCLMGIGSMAHTQAFSTTTVQGTVYLANGQPASGTLVVSWPSFTTANGQVVTADSTTVAIAPDGYLSVNLAPNQGASPAGLYYTAVYYLSDGSVNTQYWVVPAATTATLGQVQARLMPSTQAVQAVSKAYVDQAIAALAGGTLTISGTTMTGPLTLCCDPTTPLQAADKHYVDTSLAQAVPLTGGTLTGPLTSVKLGAVYQADQFAGTDFGAKLGACLSGLSATQGGTCDARNFSGTLAMGSNLTISTANATVLLPCATISTANQVIVTAGTRNVSLRGCALRGTSTASGSQGGTVFYYSGAGAMVQVGDPTYAADTLGFHLDNVAINTTLSASAGAQGFKAYRTQELDLESLYFLGNSNQTGMTLDGTGNYTGGTFYDNEFTGFQTAVNAIGHQVANPATTDWVNASTFVRLHIDCPTSGGNPISGTYGINLQSGDGNTFTGGDVEGCSTALHLGANAENNTIVGLRNENSTNQVVADAGSSYNSWMTGGTMFTGQLTDSGTRNSFLDSFHRSFNGLNGDWYGSQTDATVTNHYRLGTGAGNERGLLNRYQSDYGYRWTMGLSDAAAGEQFYQVLDELNNVYRLSVGQYNHGQLSTNNQTVINAAGTGAVVLNGSNNAGTGGVVIGSGGASETTVATISNGGNAQFNGTLQVGGASTFQGSTTVKDQADAEIDATLWAGLTASQKESFIYKDWNGNSQWYMVKDTSNNWALNSATGGLDSFKAYQSSNSGDTYIDASNNTGVVRINYETGSGTQFKVYGGNSSSLYASFTGTTTIQFPGLAASSGHNCLQVDNSGYITNTGSACSTGSSNGTVNSGSSGQIAYYSGTGTVLSGTNTVSVTAGGTGASTASGALTNLGGAALTGATFTGPLSTSSTLSAANLSSIGPRYDVTNSAFGAKGDGSTDDTAAIQAAFNACYNGGVAPYGGVVEFPGRHTYNVSSTINAYDPCRIEGVTGSASVAGSPARIAWNGSGAGTVSTITAFSISSNVVTFTAANNLTAGQFVDIEGLTTGYYLNRAILQVSATGLSSTQFTATLPFGWNNVTTASDSGTATAINVLLAFNSNARYQQSISNMDFLPAATAAPGSLQVAVYYGSRVDTGTQVLNTWASGATMYGYYFAAGGINVHFDQGWRCDGIGISCVYWRVAGADSFGIANGTVDNSSSGASSGGAMMLDNAACSNQTGIHFTSRNMKIEINTTLTPGLGVFTMYDCPSISNLEAFWLDLENTWVAPASGGSAGFNFPSFVVSPANDAAVSLNILNGNFPSGTSPNTTARWVGIPALQRNDAIGNYGWIPLLSYAPSTNSDNGYYQFKTPISLIGDVNIGQLWQDGIQASDFLYSDTAFSALPNGTTLYAGQIVAPPGYWNGANGKRYALDVVYQAGTTGTPNSGNTTCTGTIGTSVLTCNSATDLSAGQRITIGTNTSKSITYVDATRPSAVLVNLGSNLGATYSTATALSFSAPVLGPEIQLHTKSSAAPTTLAWLQGDMEQNSSATTNGVAAWVNVAAGTPGTWTGIPLGDANGNLNLSQVVSSSSSTLPVCPNGTNNALTTVGCSVSGGTTTNAQTMINDGTGASSGTTFNGSAAIKISYNSVGAGGIAAANTWNGASNSFSNVVNMNGLTNYAAGLYSVPTNTATNGNNYTGTPLHFQNSIWSTGAGAAKTAEIQLLSQVTNTADSPVVTLKLVPYTASPSTPTFAFDASAMTAGAIMPSTAFTGAVTTPTLNVSNSISTNTPYIDVRAYGAVGDSNGTTGNGTDNYAAIHAACAAASPGGHILFPAASGVYRINFAGATPASPLNACLIYANGVTVEGKGRDSQIFMDGWTVANGMAHPDGGGGLQVATAIAYGDSTHSVTGGTVRNLYVTGIWNESDLFSGTTYSRAKAVGLYNAKSIDVQNIECYNIAGNCVNWSGNTGAGTIPGNRLSFITANYSAEGGVNFMGGTNLGSMSNSRITNSAFAGIESACDDCSFDNNKFSGNQIGLDSAGSRVTITGNDSFSNSVHGIYIDPQTSDCNDVSLSNNLTYSNTQAGIAVGSSCLHATISGGTAKNNGSYGVILYGGNTGTRIVGVDASDDRATPVQQNGITVATSTGVIISGNRVVGNVVQAITLSGSTNATISGNKVDHNINADSGSTGLIKTGNNGDSSLLATNVPLLFTSGAATYIYNALTGGGVNFLDQSSGYAPINALSYGNGTNVILPYTLTGYHGTGAGDVKVQLSDGTGTNTHLAAFDANGGLTDGGAQVTLAGLGGVPTTTTVNGHALSSNVTVSASDLTTGTLPHAQLPTLLSGDIPANAANTSGTAGGLSGTPALPSGTTATTQTSSDTSTDVATDAFVHNAITAALPVANSSLTVSSSTTVSANSCNGPYTVSMSGVTTGMTFNLTATSDTHAITGWGSPSTGVLYFTDWPTANTFNYYICNNTASSITTGGAVTFNIAAR
jgi:hypothetical protein